jgi:hypothetical protein
MANYTYAFDSAVYDVTQMGSPQPINEDVNSDGWGGTFPLSAANNSFALISAGKINHERIEGVLFNYQASASAHDLQDFYLQSPGGPDHPDEPAVAVISLSATTGNGSYMRLKTTNGNMSTFFAVPSAAAADNTGDSKIAGSVFYSNTGSNKEILENITDVINNHGAAGAFTATYKKNEVVSIKQNTGGSNGNTTIVLSGLNPTVMVDTNFVGGLDEQSDATHIRAAGGATNSYNDATVAVVTKTGRTVTYKLEHGAPPRKPSPILSGFNVAVGPNMRREVLLGYR